MEKQNEMRLEFDSRSVNEGFARVAVAAFLAELNPTLDELADIKTAVSEAVTNAIIHGYENEAGKVSLLCRIDGEEIEIVVSDTGKGIADVEQAKAPFFTTKPELERSGMGFAFMEAFMDDVQVESELEKGTAVYMKKRIGRKDDC
jgi:stage II sporulation protein AB (anti-sigma F factor)